MGQLYHGSSRACGKRYYFIFFQRDTTLLIFIEDERACDCTTACNHVKIICIGESLRLEGHGAERPSRRRPVGSAFEGDGDNCTGPPDGIEVGQGEHHAACITRCLQASNAPRLLCKNHNCMILHVHVHIYIPSCTLKVNTAAHGGGFNQQRAVWYDTHKWGRAVPSCRPHGRGCWDAKHIPNHDGWCHSDKGE